MRAPFHTMPGMAQAQHCVGGPEDWSWCLLDLVAETVAVVATRG